MMSPPLLGFPQAPIPFQQGQFLFPSVEGAWLCSGWLWLPAGRCPRWALLAAIRGGYF